MTSDEDLRQMCRELKTLRDRLDDLKDRDKVLSADLVTAMQARGLDFVDFDRRQRANLETPATTRIDLDRFRATCREHDIGVDDSAAACKLTVSVTAARKLLGDAVIARIADVKPGAPRVRLITVDN